MATTARTTPSSKPLSDRELLAWRGMLRAHSAVTKALDAELEEQHEISLTSYEVLLHLEGASDGRMRMSDLASRLLLSRSGATRLVDRLERDGLIVRDSCPSDARGSFAVLTPAGAAKLEGSRRTHLAGVRRLYLDLLTAEQQEQLGAAWEKIDTVDDEPPGGCGR
jgi:DNA-binding MarR family transcriptional regulator